MIKLVVFVRILSSILVSFDLSFGAIKAASQGDQEEAKKIMLSQYLSVILVCLWHTLGSAHILASKSIFSFRLGRFLDRTAVLCLAFNSDF